MDIAGLSEIRWQGEGHFQSGDSIVIFSGGIRGQGGVAMILNKKLRGTMISYNPVSERILVVRLAMRPVNVTVVVVWNTLTVLMIVATTIPLHQDPLDVDVCWPPGNAVSGHSSTMCLVVWWLSPHGQAGDAITPHRWRDSAHLAWPHLRRFSVTNWRLGSVYPGCRHVGLVTR